MRLHWGHHAVFKDIIWSILIRIPKLFSHSVLSTDHKLKTGWAFDPSVLNWFGKITIKFHLTRQVIMIP